MKKVLLLFAAIASSLVMFGCGDKAAVKDKPSDEELAKTSKIYGVVREIDSSSIKIQLCANTFLNYTGPGYVVVDNEYGNLKKDDSVLIYYEGILMGEDKDTYAEFNDIQVCYVEKCENDGEFIATVALLGGMIPPDETVSSSSACLIPIDGYYDGQFYVNFWTKNLETGERTENDVELRLEDSWDVSVPVTVKYDTDTMEVISIIQND